MLNEYANNEVTIEEVQIGITDLERSLGELSQMCDGAGDNYCMEGRELGGLLRILQSVAHVQRMNVDYLVGQKYKGKVKTV